MVARCAQSDAALLAPLQELGLPVVWRPSPATATFRLRYVHGVRETAIEALGAPWTVADARGWLGDALRDVDWVHAGATWRGEFPAETLAALARGRRLSLDGSGLVRPGRLGPVQRDADFDRSVLAHVALLHLSEQEAAVLGVELHQRSLRALGVPEIVVTLGERGSVVLADGLAELVPARAVPGADPTGAGDAFTAAYIVHRRRGNGPVPAAAKATEVVHRLLSDPAQP